MRRPALLLEIQALPKTGGICGVEQTGEMGSDRDNLRLMVCEFAPCGILFKEWENKRARVGMALGSIIAKMEWGERRKVIRVYAVPARSARPTPLER